MGVGNLLKLIGLFLFIIVVFSFNYIWAADANNDTVVQNAARNAMTQAINKGSVRVTEEITINEKMAEEAFLRQYAETANFNDGTRVLNVVDISSKPAMLAVESYNVIEGLPIFKWLNQEKTAKTREVDVLIYEAKKTNK
jgi:Family of unknown function (DUF5411)